MAGIYYRDFGTVPAGQDDAVQQRLRLAQMERALDEAACLGARGAAAAMRTALPGLSGEVLEKGDPGGDEARVIEPGYEAPWRAR